MDEAEAILLLTTAPTDEVARQIGTVALERQLAACVTTVPGARSRYWWEGKIEESDELLLVLKTTPQAAAALREVIAEAHPYEVPELLEIPATGGSPDYLGWLQQQVSSPEV